MSACEACGAHTGEACDPFCLGIAAAQDTPAVPLATAPCTFAGACGEPSVALVKTLAQCDGTIADTADLTARAFAQHANSYCQKHTELAAYATTWESRTGAQVLIVERFA